MFSPYDVSSPVALHQTMNNTYTDKRLNTPQNYITWSNLFCGWALSLSFLPVTCTDFVLKLQTLYWNTFRL